jgi:hypothetical protein
MGRRCALLRRHLVVCIAGAWLWAGTGCARPFSGPKTLAAIGAGLLIAGSAAWIAGERGDRHALVVSGIVTTALGAGAVVAAGGWLASSIACGSDADCPTGEQCREVPAPPGGIPYKQCMRR